MPDNTVRASLHLSLIHIWQGRRPRPSVQDPPHQRQPQPVVRRVGNHPLAVSYTHLDVYKRQGLRRLNVIGKQLRFNGHIFIHAHIVHQRLQALAAEQPRCV